MFKLYRKSQEVQYAWIRNHPVQYVAPNVTLIDLWIGYMEYKDRKEMREIQNEIAQEKNQS